MPRNTRKEFSTSWSTDSSSFEGERWSAGSSRENRSIRNTVGTDGAGAGYRINRPQTPCEWAALPNLRHLMRSARVISSQAPGPSARRSPSPGFLTYVLLELTAELSIERLGKWVVSKTSDRRIHPCQRPRAGEIARAS